MNIQNHSTIAGPKDRMRKKRVKSMIYELQVLILIKYEQIYCQAKKKRKKVGISGEKNWDQVKKPTAHYQM